MEEHILSDVLRNVTNQIAVPFGAAVLATEEATISADVFGELQGKMVIIIVTFHMLFEYILYSVTKIIESLIISLIFVCLI
jgi:hypothetical protein